MRSGDCGRGAGRTGCRGLCGVGGPENGGAGELCAGRTGGVIVTDRKFLWLSHGHWRRRFDLQRATSSVSVWREICHACPGVVAGINNGEYRATLQAEGCSATLCAKCVIIATGAQYRRLEAEGREDFEGAGVYYAATGREANLCRGSTVIVAGGGNSAGQAAMFLSEMRRRYFWSFAGRPWPKACPAISRGGWRRKRTSKSSPTRISANDGRQDAGSSRIGKHQDRGTAHRPDFGHFFHDRRETMHGMAAPGILRDEKGFVKTARRWPTRPRGRERAARPGHWRPAAQESLPQATCAPDR